MLFLRFSSGFFLLDNNNNNNNNNNKIRIHVMTPNKGFQFDYLDFQTLFTLESVRMKAQNHS
jgi:type II secretory pathway component HofQ